MMATLLTSIGVSGSTSLNSKSNVATFDEVDQDDRRRWLQAVD